LSGNASTFLGQKDIVRVAVERSVRIVTSNFILAVELKIFTEKSVLQHTDADFYTGGHSSLSLMLQHVGAA
jgi:hypothetical protein